MPLEFNPFKANIFQVKLDHEYGYTLVKVVILQGNFSIDYHVIYPVLHYDKEIFKEINLSDKVMQQHLCAAIIKRGEPKTKGRNNWKLAGHTDLTVQENNFPELRESASMWTAKNEADEKWKLVKNFDNRSVIYPFEKIRHLGLASSTGSQKDITTLLTMIWMKRNNENIDSYFTKDEFEKDFWLKIFADMAARTVYYDTIDKLFWNKAIP